MNWIKDNKFLVVLCGGTLVGVVLLYIVGSKGTNRYEAAKTTFDEAYSEAQGYEKQPLYPKTENVNGKTKALDEYRKSLESLQGAFGKYRPKEIINVSPQEFTTRLKASDSDVRKAFEAAGTAVPDAFFMGFESYKTTLARPNATGIMSYQMDAIKGILMELAKASPKEFKNLYRPPLPEENGQAYKAPANAVARELPLEITFVGPEKSVRAFFSDIEKLESRYAVIRTLRIENSKQEPPRASDAKFEKPASAKPPESGPFGGVFVLPNEQATPAAEDAKPSETAPPTPSVNTGRILSQVLGDEQVQVFVRLDILEFLPVKKLP